MQHSPIQLKEKLLQSLDEEQNVVDMPGVLQVISALEICPLTKEALEQTRIGRFVNEMRRKTTDKTLAKRAKNLVRMWQKQIQEIPRVPSGGALNGEGLASNGAASVGATGTAPPRYTPEQLKRTNNGSKPASPASGPATPGRRVSPGLPAMRATQPGSRSTSPRSTTSSRPGTPGLGSDPYNNNNITQFSSKLSPLAVDSPATTAASTPGSTAHQVSKTNAANKRKRHRNGTSPLGDAPPPKTSRRESKTNAHGHIVNGAVSKNCSHTDLNVSVGETNSNSCDRKSPSFVLQSKHGSRSRGDKSTPSLVLKRNSTLPARLHDSDKIQPRTPKVKTTAELIKEMSASGGLRVEGSRTATRIVLDQIQKEKDDIDSPVVPPGAKPRFRRKPGTAVVPPVSADHTLTQTKTEMMAKFLQSQPQPEIPDFLLPEETDQSAVAAGSGTEESVAQSSGGSKLVSFFVGDDDVETTRVSDSSAAKTKDPATLLPPINLADVDWTTDDYTTYEPKPVEESDVDRLDQEQIPGVNGQLDSDSAWREWTDTVSVPSYNSDLLHILPYVNIDD